MNNKDWTPEELELKEALNKLYESDTREPSRPLDLSFMEAPEKQSFFKRHPRLVNVAAIVAVVFVTAFITANVVANDYVSAAKEQVQRKVFEMKHGVVVATDEEFAEEGETVWEITDFEVAKKAKELVPELPIPGYVPEGYEFEKLVLHQYDGGRFIAKYSYINSIDLLQLDFISMNDDTFSFSSYNTETIETDNYTLAIWEDPIAKDKGASIFFENYMLEISFNTNLSTNELLLIANNI